MAALRRHKSFLHAASQAPSQVALTAHALEDHFAQVTMTPPAAYGSLAFRDSPFGEQAMPSLHAATELRKPPFAGPSKMTRTSAFGPLAPLQSGGVDSSEGRGSAGGLKRTTRLNESMASTRDLSSLLAPDEDESSETSADERRFDGQASPSVYAAKQRQGHRHIRSKTSGTAETSSVAQRRGRTPVFLFTKGPGVAGSLSQSGSGEMMDLDSDAEAGAPPSPSPVSEGTFPSESSRDLLERSDILLQPGPFQQRLWQFGGRRASAGGEGTGSVKGVTVLGQLPDSAPNSSTELFPRNFTLPSMVGSSRPTRHHKTASSASSSAGSSFGPFDQHVSESAAAAKSASSSSSPYKTKRRLTATDRGTRTRADSLAEDDVQEHSSLSLGGAEDSSGGLFSPNVLSSSSSREAKKRSGSYTRSQKQDKSFISRLQGADGFGLTPSKTPGGLDDSGVNFSFPASIAEQSETPFGKGSRILTNSRYNRAKFDDTPEKGLFAPSPSLMSHTRKSPSVDSLTSTPAKGRPASINHRGPFNPFGPITRSSLAHEATLPATPGSGDSAASSPEHFSQRTTSVPEGLSVGDSPLPPYMTPQNFNNIKPLQAAFMSTGLVSKRTRGPAAPATGEEHLGPLPPRPNYANATAPGEASAVTGSGGVGNISAATMGLKEVVAATARRGSLTGVASTMPDTPMKKPAATTLGQHLIGGAAKAVAIPTRPARQPPPSVLRPSAASRQQQAQLLGNLGSVPAAACLALSPGTEPGSQTSDTSPVLGGQGFESPTMNLNSKTIKASDEWHFSMLPNQRSDRVSPLLADRPFPMMRRTSSRTSLSASTASETEGALTQPATPTISIATADPPTLIEGERPTRLPLRRVRTNATVPTVPPSALTGKSTRLTVRPTPLRSYSDQMAGTRNRSKLGDSQESETGGASETELGVPARPTFMRHRSRPGLGLQRKSSFSMAGVESGSFGRETLVSPTVGLFPVPSTPTRGGGGGQLKWFEAARMVTTPSPPSRRQAKASLQYAQGGSKTKGPSSSRGTHHTLTSTPAGQKFARGPTSPLAQRVHASRFETNFTQLAVLGSGEFSEAVKAEEKSTGKVFAIKRMKRRFTGPKDRLRHMEEVEILRHLGTHPNVISMIDAWEEEGQLYIQMTLCPLGTLASVLDVMVDLDEPRLFKVLTELASGLDHLHSKGVVHCDIKPENCLLTQMGSLKIADLGMAFRIDDPSQTVKKGVEREGDRRYLASEVISSGAYSPNVDIFALGLLMVESIGGVELPDNGISWSKLRNDNFEEVDFSSISVSLYKLVRSLCASDPIKRPTARQILDHPVLQAVQERMKMGLDESELDQLPDVDVHQQRLPTIQSAGSLCSAGEGSSQDDTMASDDQGATTSSANKAELRLDIRGALINEPPEFLDFILSHDPDPTHRELVQQWIDDEDEGGAVGGRMLNSWQEESGDDSFNTSGILGMHFADETLSGGESFEAPSREGEDEGILEEQEEDSMLEGEEEMMAMDEDEDAFS